MRIGFVGGGTGGHFYPLIAVAEVLIQNPEKPDLYYFGPTPYAPELLEAYNITFVRCPAGKLRRYFSLLNVVDVFKTGFGIFVAIWKLYWYYPDVIFSKGGYTSVPILLAARFLRIPVVIHESDVQPGRANRLAKKFARYIAISWAESAEYFPGERTALTGIPIRQHLLHADPDAHANLGIPNDAPLVYVTGGSLGAERINTLILNSLNELLPHVRIFHQTGSNNEEYVKQTARELLVDRPDWLERYYVAGTIPANTVNSLLSAASIVISRAGSTSLYEIGVHGVPAIIIPIPEEISHDQRSNAYTYARTGGAVVIEEHNLTEHLLETELLHMLQDTARYQEMSAAAKAAVPTGGAAAISEALLQIGHEHGS